MAWSAGQGGNQGLQLLRGRSVQLRGGTTTLREPTLETSEDRSAGCAGAVRQLGELFAWQPRCNEHRSGSQPRTGTATLGGASPRAAGTQSTPSRGAGSGASSDPRNPGPGGLVATSGLEGVKTQVPEWMGSQLKHWQEEALATDGKERQVGRELEKMVSIELPIGVGALSWITLELEIRGWDRFQNRRQIASYTGLCPGIHNSNGRGREGHINRCGNSVVRYTLIEMVWRMTRWQPDYPPIKKLRSTVSKRGERRFVVAAARRLAIDLWRWATGRATAKELGLQFQLTMTQKPSV